MTAFFSKVTTAYWLWKCSPLLFLQFFSGRFVLLSFPNWGNSAKPSPCLLYFSACMLLLQKLIVPPRCLPRASVVKNPPANAGDMVSIPGLGRTPGEGKGNPCQYSCLANLMDRGAWRATVPGVAKTVRHDLATKQQTTTIQLGPFYSLLPHHHFIPLRLSPSRDRAATPTAWAAG